MNLDVSFSVSLYHFHNADSTFRYFDASRTAQAEPLDRARARHADAKYGLAKHDTPQSVALAPSV